jgi:hypothetical protein
MILVRKKKFDESYEKYGIIPGKEYYVLRYRSGMRVFDNFPDRASFTKNIWYKKLYTIDDAIHLFDAVDVEGFNLERNRIVSQIDELTSEFESKRKPYPENNSIYVVLSFRIETLNEWKERILNVKIFYPIERSVKKLRKQHPKLH